MTNIDEQDLVTGLKAGDEQYVALWYRQYKDKIDRYISTKISLAEDREELLQEIFLTSLRELPHFRGQSSLMTWMLTIARHKVADFYRAKYAKRVIHVVSLLDELELPSMLETFNQLTDVQTALSRLAPDLRELLLAKYVDGKTLRELASELKKTTKAVESMLFRARNEFKYVYLDQAREGAPV